MNLIPAPASLVPASHNRGPRSASRLYYYAYRYFNPTTGRWPSRNNGMNKWDYLGQNLRICKGESGGYKLIFYEAGNQIRPRQIFDSVKAAGVGISCQKHGAAWKAEDKVMRNLTRRAADIGWSNGPDVPGGFDFAGSDGIWCRSFHCIFLDEESIALLILITLDYHKKRGQE